MNYKDAFEILEIDVNEIGYNNINLKYLKKKYHKLALQNHPDKNGNTEESTEKFKQIGAAYNFLKREMIHLQPDILNESTKNNENNENTEENEDHNSSLYFDILQLFMKNMMEGKYTEIISKIVNDIVFNCKKVTLKLFDDLDKDTSLNTYLFLSKYKNILHINEKILDQIREIVIQKYDNVQIYKLNPSINDLLNNNVYKLYIDGELYLVPLWYSESYYDGSGCEIIVMCEPELEKNITVDEDNNICVNIEIELATHLINMFENNNTIDFKIGDKTFCIPFSQLYIKREQNYKIKNQGISKIKKEIYDISEKADIIVSIKFV